MGEHPADWLARQYKAPGQVPTLDEGHRRCMEVLVTITWPSGLYNLMTPCSVAEAVKVSPGAVSVLLYGELATHDADGLTRLVVAAHARHVRVALRPWRAHLDQRRAEAVAAAIMADADHAYRWDDPGVSEGVYDLLLTPRVATGDTYTRHPSAGDLAARALAAIR